MATADPNVVHWCGGLEAVGHRFALAADRQRAESLQRSCRRRGILSLLSLPAMIPFTVILAYGFEAFAEKRGTTPVVVGWSCFTIISVAGILAIVFTVHSAQYFRRSAALRKEMASGRLLICEGPVFLVGPAVARFVRRGSVRAKIEAFANSGLLWTVNGEPVRAWIFLKQGQTPRSPADEALKAFAASNEPAPSAPTPVEGSRRFLSAEEQAELRAYIPPIGAKIIITAAVWNLAAVALAIEGVLTRHVSVIGPWSGVAMIAAALAYDRRFSSSAAAADRSCAESRSRQPEGIDPIRGAAEFQSALDGTRSPGHVAANRITAVPGPADPV